MFIEFAWQGFGSRGGYKASVTSLRSCEKIPTYPVETPLLAKAKHISNGGNSSVRRAENYWQEQLQPERGARMCERISSADTEVSEEEEEVLLVL